MDTIPGVAARLPELFAFARTLGHDYESGTLKNWEQARQRMRSFFSLAMLNKVEVEITGWNKMASYNEGGTLFHVVTALAALLMLPEYRQATPNQQAIAQWTVLFHDIQKEPHRNKRDHRHGFRSAALTGLTLKDRGFTVPAARDALHEWASCVDSALIPHPVTRELIHDHRQLPHILAQTDRVFGVDAPAALIVKAIMLHMAIDVVKDWPQAASLSDDEIARYITPPLFSILQIMMLVDNDAYAFFDPEQKARNRASTRRTFNDIARLIGIPAL